MNQPSSTTEPTVSDLADWMTAEEVANHLGITTLVLARQPIPHAEIGASRHRVYNQRDIAEWLAQKR